MWEVADCLVGNVGVAESAETFLCVSNPGDTASEVRGDVFARRQQGAGGEDAHGAGGGRLTIWVNGTAPELTNERFGAGIGRVRPAGRGGAVRVLELAGPVVGGGDEHARDEAAVAGRAS